MFYFYNCNLEPGIKGLQKVAVGARLQRCLSNSCDCQVRLCNLCILAEQTRLAWRQEFRSVHYASSVWLVVAGLRRIRIFRNLSETTLHQPSSITIYHYCPQPPLPPQRLTHTQFTNPISSHSLPCHQSLSGVKTHISFFSQNTPYQYPNPYRPLLLFQY